MLSKALSHPAFTLPVDAVIAPFLGERLSLREDCGLTQGPGPTRTRLTPPVTECSQVSPRNPGPGSPDAGVDFGVTQCHPLLCDHKEEPRKGGSLPEQWVGSIFRNFRHKGDPHHLQVRLLEED